MPIYLHKLKTHLFKAKILNLDPNSCKSDFLKRFGITGRQYNACQTLLQGKINSIKERRDLQIADLEEKIKACEAKLKRIRNPFTIHQKKRHLTCLQDKLAKLKRDREQNITRLCFGSKKLFHAQFALEENGFSSHSEWKEAWEKSRSSEFFVLGSKDEVCGNQSCSAFLQEDGTLSLRLRLPHVIAKSHGSYLVIPSIKFNYGHKDIVAALLAKQALCYRFKKDKKGWRVFVSVNTPPSPIITNEELGRIGIDINTNHLSLIETDRFGNPIYKETIPLCLNGKNTNQSKALIGDACKKIVDIAQKAKKPIVLEKLDFKQKKTSLKEKTTSYARMLSSFAYSSILSHIKSQERKDKESKSKKSTQLTPPSLVG